MSYAVDVVPATCACDRVISIAASLLASASFTCGDCQQPLTPLARDVQGEHHALTV